MALPVPVRSTSGRLNTGQVLTLSAFDGTGGDCLEVGVHLFQDIAISSVTYGGVNLSQVRRERNTANNAVAEIWYLASPPSGANDIVITAASSTNELVAGATLMSGTAAVPLDAHNGATGGSTNTPTVSITTTAAESLVVDAMSTGAATTATVGANQTQQYNDSTRDPLVGGSTEDAAGAAAYTMSWTLGANRQWAIAAASFKASAGGGASIGSPLVGGRLIGGMLTRSRLVV